jgi:RNA polymerase sigma-70 factor, ECF subfamily
MASPIQSGEWHGRGDTASRLVEAARQGHDDAFGRLFESFRRHLLLLAHRELPATLRGKIGPSDLVQETAVDARRNIPGFRGSTAEECYAWLRAILRNNMIDAVRHFETTQKRGGCREISLATDAGRCQGGMVAIAHGGPDGSAIRREDADVLAKVLLRLSDDHRTVLRLRYWEGLSFPEIGGRLGRSPDAVRKLWYRAVERLQEEMNHEASHASQGSDVDAIGAVVAVRK